MSCKLPVTREASKKWTNGLRNNPDVTSTEGSGIRERKEGKVPQLEILWYFRRTSCDRNEDGNLLGLTFPFPVSSSPHDCLVSSPSSSDIGRGLEDLHPHPLESSLTVPVYFFCLVTRHLGTSRAWETETRNGGRKIPFSLTTQTSS